MFSEVKSDTAAAADESEKNRYDVDMIRFLTEAWDKWNVGPNWDDCNAGL